MLRTLLDRSIIVDVLCHYSFIVKFASLEFTGHCYFPVQDNPPHLIAVPDSPQQMLAASSELIFQPSPRIVTVLCSPLQRVFPVRTVQRSLFAASLDMPEILGYLKEICERQKQLAEQQQQMQERPKRPTRQSFLPPYQSLLLLHFHQNECFLYQILILRLQFSLSLLTTTSLFNYGCSQLRKETSLFNCFSICFCPVNLRGAMLGESG